MNIKSILICFFIFAVSPRGYSQAFKKADPKDIALVPIENSFRDRIDLSGIWNFKVDSLDVGIKQGWSGGLDNSRQIAVPGSWNEQFTDLRDYLERVWYETEVFVPESWKNERVYIRVDDATYAAKIWINGVAVGEHDGCHVPFAFNLNPQIRWGKSNKITIQVENIQSPSRVPTGNVAESSFGNYPNANYDFFPYSGLNRRVYLYAVPAEGSIRDITVKTGFSGSDGHVNITVESEGVAKSAKVVVSGNGQSISKEIAITEGKGSGDVLIPNVRLWSPESPDLYQVSVSLKDGENEIDEYTLQTGVRTISADENHVYLNGKPIFLKGFGKHIDFPVVGRGTADPVMIKDFELMKWCGANSFRTTHYPYDEEFYNLADKQGLMIIAETPSVGLFMTGDSIDLEHRQAICKQYLKEVVYRNKNHPSVVMWCVANEPNDKAQLGIPGPVSATDKERAYELFKEHFDLTRQLDSTRLVIYVGPMMGPSYWFELTDVIAINRYWGWYTTPGGIAEGASVLSSELSRLHRKFKKPVMVTEFGCDTYAGMHSEEPEMFTEEYQVDFIKAYLDVAEQNDFVAGMHVWNFSDFKTSQSVIRLGGYNLKGVFTRDRKPKMAAHYLRSRWNSNVEQSKTEINEN